MKLQLDVRAHALHWRAIRLVSTTNLKLLGTIKNQGDLEALLKKIEDEAAGVVEPPPLPKVEQVKVEESEPVETMQQEPESEQENQKEKELKMPVTPKRARDDEDEDMGEGTPKKPRVKSEE